MARILLFATALSLLCAALNAAPAHDKPIPAELLQQPGHKDAKPSNLEVEFTIAEKFVRTSEGVILPVLITNHSDKQITTNLLHVPAGGTHPLTDLYASVTPMGSAKGRRFDCVYRAEVREAADKTVLAPGKSVFLELRMDWRGTGSVPIAHPFLEASGQGGYKVRLLMVFDAAGKQQFVVSPAKVVEVRAR